MKAGMAVFGIIAIFIFLSGCVRYEEQDCILMQNDEDKISCFMRMSLYEKEISDGINQCRRIAGNAAAFGLANPDGTPSYKALRGAGDCLVMLAESKKSDAPCNSLEESYYSGDGFMLNLEITRCRFYAKEKP